MKATMTTKQENTEPRESLNVLTENIKAMLKDRDPSVIDGIPSELHPLPPFISKKYWTELGDAVKVAEKPHCDSVPGEKWISLRCDGSGFSKLTRCLRKNGIFQSKGFSKEFADIMVKCCRVLMTKFNAKAGYTQSDEMTVLIAPGSVVRGEQQPHMYSGRVQKLASLASSIITAHFNHELTRLCLDKGMNVSILDNLLASFDCRVGMYDTQDEAASLILWRSYDCGVNGVADAVLHCKGQIEGAGPAFKLPKHEKLQWLRKHNLLPLEAHQRDGTYLVRKRLATNAVNQKTGEEVLCLRSRIIPIEGNVLLMCKHDKMFP